MRKYLMEWTDRGTTRHAYVQTADEQHMRDLAQRIRQYDDVGEVTVMVNPDTDSVEYLSGYRPKVAAA